MYRAGGAVTAPRRGCRARAFHLSECRLTWDGNDMRREFDTTSMLRSINGAIEGTGHGSMTSAAVHARHSGCLVAFARALDSGMHPTGPPLRSTTWHEVHT